MNVKLYTTMLTLNACYAVPEAWETWVEAQHFILGRFYPNLDPILETIEVCFKL